MKQAVKKGAGVKSLSPADKLAALKAFKENNNLTGAKEKDPSWIILPEAFQSATRLPGIPQGYVSAIRGHSNTGKSTIKLEVIKAAQAQGIVPVVFELENNFAWKHAKCMGVNINEYPDEETGEIMYGPGDDMLYYDTAKLYEIYGKFDHEHGKWLSKPARETYVIEDVAMCIKDLIRKQREGELPFDMIFIIDSIGVGDCYRSATSNSSNNQWFAGALSNSFNTIVNDLIPSSRNVNSPYLNTMFVVQKIWVASTAMGLPSVKNKGGQTLQWAYRVLIHLGGVESASIKALKATSGGRNYQFGTQVKVKVEKNHVDSLTYEGEICCVDQGLWDPNKIDKYKKEYGAYIRQKLADGGNMSAEDIGDIEYSEEEVTEG